MTIPEETTKRIQVSPAKAQEWLKINEANRPLRRAAVARMATDMAAGLWNQANPQPLIFDTTGALIDGQHRLTAQVQANATLWWCVATEVPRQTQLVIDDHIPRQIHDFAKWEMPGLPISPRHVACANTMLQGMPGSKVSAFTRSIKYRFMREHMEAIEFALGRFTKRVPHITTATTAAIIARAFYTDDHARLSRFAEVLETGQTIHANESAAVTLSRWLLVHARARREQYAKTERALRAFLDEESLLKLQAATKELFPLSFEREQTSDEEVTEEGRKFLSAGGAL